MLNRRDIDLNSTQSSTDTLKQKLKQTMLNQELVFMRQVYELHRLHRIQIAMMEDYKQKGLDYYTLHKGGLNSSSEIQNDQAKCSMAEFVQSENFKLLEEQKKRAGFMQKPLDLQLSADEYISRGVNEFSGKEVRRGLLKESIELKNASNLDDLKLSLSTGQDVNKKGEGHRSWMSYKTCASSSDVIDLEDPYLDSRNNDAYLGLTSDCVAWNLCSRGKHKLESFPQSGMRDVSDNTSKSRSLVAIGSNCQKSTPSDSGFNEHHREFFSADPFSKDQKSRKANNLDLNIAQPEDSSYFADNHSIVHNLSAASFSGVSDKNYASVSPAWRQANVNNCTESSDVHQQLDLNFDLSVKNRDNDKVQSNKREKFIDGVEGKIRFIELGSDSCEDLCSSRCDPKRIESVDSSSGKVSGRVDLVRADANVERDAQTHPLSHSCLNQMVVEHTNCHKLSTSSESECIVDHQSSSLKTMQSGVKCGDISFSTSDESQKAKKGPPADHSAEQDQKSSDSTESNIQCINRMEPEVDEIVQSAAELLVQISSVTPFCNQGGGMRVTSEQFQNEQENQPQHSSESYEALVLKAKESDPDDYCVTSNPFVVDDLEKKDSRYKLKRGTRMKDFQKDVLPSLSVLSRYEIREDINIMEGVIRSREYKKMRGKMADGGDWCRSSRSKRSRVSNRRYYE